MSNLVLLALVALPAAGALGLLLAGPARRDALARSVGLAVSVLVLLLTMVCGGADDLDVAWVPSLEIRFHLGVDGISQPLLILTAGLVALCMLHLRRILPKAGRPGALIGLLLLLEAGALGTFLALDLIVFFVFFETVLIPMYFVIAAWGDSSPSVTKERAAITFLLYTVLGSALMLVGLLLVRIETGTSDLVSLAASGGAQMSRTTQIVAALAIGIGLAVKAPMWPLHTWLPDAHTAAPTVGSVLLAGVLLKMGTYGMVRVLLPVVPEGARAIAPYLAALAVVGIIWGSLACLAQRDAKRLIAYSSVGHMGFVLLGIATLTEVGVNGALFANIAHGIITGLLFFLVGAVKDRHGTTSLDELGGGLYARAPLLGGLLAFAAVASLGLPGLAGFWGEALAMLGAWDPADGLDRDIYLLAMALAGAGTVLTAAYLLRLVRAVAQGEVLARWREAVLLPDASRFELLVWSPLVGAALLLGLWPGLLLDVTVPAVAGLMEPLRGAG